MSTTIWRIAESVDVQLCERSALDSLSYDGKTIATHLRSGQPFQDGEILHEVCHYLAATAEERLAPEFGMVARPGLRYSKVSSQDWEKYERRTPSPIVQRPNRHIRECATQYLHYGVAKVLGMCPAVPNTDWRTWVHGWHHKWIENGVPWLKSQGQDPDALIEHMIMAAQIRMAA